MNRSRKRNGAALVRDAVFSSICSAVWPLLVSGALVELQRLAAQESGAGAEEILSSLSGWQRRLLGLFSAGLTGTALAAHEALPLLVGELRTPGGLSRVLLRMPALIQEETRLVLMAEAMAEAQQFAPDVPAVTDSAVQEVGAA
jgi:hypothetical protein